MNAAFRVAALLGFLGVALGAFGAHIVKDMVSPVRLDNWQTGVLYQLIHAVAALWAAQRSALVVWIWTAGVVLFSGSLYLLALTSYTKLGMVTPLGGLCFLAGWLILMVRAKA